MHTTQRNSIYLVIMIIFAGLAVTGCLNGAVEKSMAQPMTVTIDAKAEIQNGKLLVHYRVDNGLKEPIYLVNRVSKWTSAGFSIDSNLVYTEIINNTLHLTKAYINVPEDIDVEAPDVPFLTKVAAGDRFEESISQPLPLVPYHPYSQVKPSVGISIFEQPQLAVGWLPSKNVSLRTVTRPGNLTLLSANYLEVAKEQKLLISTLDVKVSAHIQR